MRTRPRALLMTLRDRLAGLRFQPRTVRMFRDDPLLLVLTFALSLSALSPIFATPILPLVDLGSNMGAASLLDDAASGRGVIAEYYAINPNLIPYWTVYLLIALLERFMQPLLVAKVVVGIAVVLLPVSAMRLLTAFGRSPRLGLWVFLLTWDNNLYWGWITFQYGMAFALFAIALLVEMRSTRDALKLLPLTVIVALTHLNAVALLLVAGGLLALFHRPFARGLAQHTIALSGCILPILPWIQSKLTTVSLDNPVPFVFVRHDLRHKLQNLFTYSVDVLPEGQHWTGLAFALLLIGTPALTLLPLREPTGRQQRAAAFLLLACAGLYFGLPFAIGGAINHWYTYPRYATYILIALLAVPRPRLRGASTFALAPGFICAVLVHQGVFEQFKSYGDTVAPYVEIIRAIPKHSRLLPIDLDDYRFRGTREAVLGQLHGYAAAETSSYDPHLFEELNNPLHFRADKKLPHPNWYLPGTFTMKDHGRYYDYVIVHPRSRDPLRGRKTKSEVELVKEAGEWRLYKVRARKPFPRSK